MKNLSQKILFLILLVLPIVDQVYKFDGNSPAVLMQAVVAIFMIFIMSPMMLRYGYTQNALVQHVFFLLVYTVFITLLIDKGFTSVYALGRVLYPWIGFLWVFYLTKYSVLDGKFFATFIFSLIVIYGAIIFLNTGYRMAARSLSVADNTGYLLVMILGGVMLFSKKKLHFPLGIFIIFIGVIISGKRGAILALLLAAIPLAKYIFTSYSRSDVKKMFYILLAILGVFFALYMLGDYFDATEARFQSLQEDGGSGRTWMYQLYFYHFLNSDIIYQTFGHGLYAGLIGKGRQFAFMNKIAHSDWLEILYDFGVVGIVIFILIHIDIFRQIRRSRNVKDNDYYMLIITSIVFYIKALVSGTFLMSPDSIYMFTLLAYSMAKLDVRKTCYKEES